LQRFDRKLDSEDGGERSGRGLPEGTSETHLRLGKVQGYPRSYLTRSLALARASLGGASTRTRGKLACSIDRSLHLYLTLNFRIYIATSVVCFTFHSLVDRLIDRIRT
jgi:hypothetical protein